MTVPTNHGSLASAGSYATTRRGGLTNDEIRQAKALRGKNWGWQNIANVLGRCREDVQQALEPIKLEAIPAPNSTEVLVARSKIETEARDRRFAEMWSSNASVADIADHFAVSSNTINSWRIRLNLPSRLAPKLAIVAASTSKTCGVEAERIAESIANTYGFRLKDLAPAPSRSYRYSRPRQHIMSVLMQSGYSTVSIGTLLHTDHGTVSYGAQSHRRRQAQDMAA